MFIYQQAVIARLLQFLNSKDLLKIDNSPALNSKWKYNAELKSTMLVLPILKNNDIKSPLWAVRIGNLVLNSPLHFKEISIEVLRILINSFITHSKTSLIK